MRFVGIAVVIGGLVYASGCSRAERESPAGANDRHETSAQAGQPATTATQPWRTDVTSFVRELYECVKRCPDPAGGFHNPGAVLEHNPYATFLTVSGGRKYGMFDGDTPLGKTTQGEINRVIGDGAVDWTVPVTEIEENPDLPDEKGVTFALPKLSPLPLTDWATSYGVTLWIPAPRFQELAISTGSVIRFTGSVGKKERKEQGNMSGVTALHALEGTTTNLLNVFVDHETVRILTVHNP